MLDEVERISEAPANGQFIRNRTFTADCQNDGFVPNQAIPARALATRTRGRSLGMLKGL
jgi:hypothetical protein